MQQAWDYAIDAPGAHWVLVSNCLEIRLYGFGRGRDAYEVFDLARLDEEGEHARLWLMLSAERALGGGLDALLRETDGAYKDITEELYRQYKDLRERLIRFLVDSADGPKLSTCTRSSRRRKSLTAYLFIAFAQRTDLLPDRLLEFAAEARNDFVPRPRWDNFIALFRAVDRGNANLGVWPYNGGLFAEDSIADKIALPDELAADVAKLGQWDYRSEVPVTLLGHIFEQSISDIERLKAEATGAAPPKVSKRKREGVVYTPDMVTRFVVEKTIGAVLNEAFAGAEQRHGMGEGASKASQIAFWRDYLASLRAQRIVDPACGSGAFLVAAYDALAFEYRRAEKALQVLDVKIDFDVADEILTRNLYGVDVNPESVEITRLSLWLKTARRDHKLQNLETTIRVGDSLIEDPAYTPRAFDWRAAFPEVFDRGGFDVVVGNPPYVRMELIKAVKPYLDSNYSVGAQSTDLYAYFYERGIRLLRQGGRLGFISSSTFFRTGSGSQLRKLISTETSVECIIDFGDAQVFEGVTTYPTIISVRKGGDRNTKLAYLVIKGAVPNNLSRSFKEEARYLANWRLSDEEWVLATDFISSLLSKISNARKTLAEKYSPPIRGILTGINEAFVIDNSLREQFLVDNIDASEFILPYIRGVNVKKWNVEYEDLWLVDIPFGWTRAKLAPQGSDVHDLSESFAWGEFAKKFPALSRRLSLYRDRARKRLDRGQYWWELRACTYMELFAGKKIVCPDLSQGPKFSIEEGGRIPDCTVFAIANTESYLLPVLNSRLVWFFLFSVSNPMRGGKWRLRMKTQYVSRVPIPHVPPAARDRLAALGQTCTGAAQKRFTIQSAVRRRILDLATLERAKLTGKLHNWFELDFPRFRAEVKHAFGAEIPVRERGEWETYLSENAAAVKSLSDEIATAEREIDVIVYELFDLTPDEIALLEASLEGQY